MIRALAYGEHGEFAKTVVLLGLEPENLRRMLAGDPDSGSDEPISVNLRHLIPDGPPTELPDIDIVIFAATPGALEALKGLLP